jgi:hypothetical protein
VKCPHCQHEFELTAARYLKLVRRKFVCPLCSKPSVSDPHPVVASVMMFSGTIIGLLGMAIAKPWLGVPGCIAGAFPLFVLAFPVGIMVDRKWGRLKPVGDLEPAAFAPCAECKSEFSVLEMIAHNSLYYCARCKPVFLQKLAEGAATRPRARSRHPLRTWWYWFWIAFAALATWLFAHYWLNS